MALITDTTSIPGAILMVTSALTGPSLTLVTVPGKLLRALSLMKSSQV
jgi:hypothetical protein